MQNSLRIAAVGVFAGALLLFAQSPRSIEVQFKAAQHKEQVEGDLKGAIEQYKRVVQNGERAIAARALVAMGQCYEKLGYTEARSTYERVVREFGDQPESVGRSRARLAALTAPEARIQIARQIWTSRSDEDPSESVPSPDGRYLSFTNWGTGDLGLRDLTTGTNRLLTNTGGWERSGDYAEGSAVSPDGRQTAYSWFMEREGRNELRVVSAGGTPRTLYRGENHRDYMKPQGWTRDGKQLLVIHTLPDSTRQIAMVSLQDGSVRAIKSFSWQKVTATLSPNDRYIAYDAPATDKTLARDVFVLAIDGSQETAVVQHSADDFSPMWSPDGSRILFLSDRSGGYSLWAVPVREGRPQSSPILIKSEVGRISPLGITSTGTLYYELTGSGRSNIYTTELSAEKNVSKQPVLTTERFINSNTGPALSRDGQYLAWYSQRQEVTNLVVHNMKTGEEKDLPLGRSVVPLFGSGPQWFPNGRSMLILSRGSKGAGFDLSRVDLANGNIEVLHHSSQFGFQGFALSPDGKAIFYTQGSSDSSILTNRLLRFDLDSRQETELKHGEWFISPTVSPDGKQLAYLVSVRPGSSSYLAIMSSAGGESREIFRGSPWMDASRYATLTWTPDQRYLLFVRGGVSDRTPNVLWRIPISGGQPEQMGLSVAGRIKSPQIDPGGTRLFFGQTETGPNEVWAMENFLAHTISAK